MIECKNKGCIVKSDMEQFEDHYTNDMKDNKYQIAIMIADGVDNILGKGCWVIETYNNYKIGYLTLSKSYTIKQKIDCLLCFFSTMNDNYKLDNKDNLNISTSNDIIINTLFEINKDIIEIEKYELKQIDYIKKKYEHKQSKLQYYINECEMRGIPIPVEIQNSEFTNELFLEKLIKKISSIKCINIPKLKWKQWLIDNCHLDEFYIQLLNKKGMTRDKIINMITNNNYYIIN